MTINNIANLIIQAEKSVLILDTCCILDIIRCIQRESLNVLSAALCIIDDYRKNQNNYFIIIPSVVSLEWADHCQNVMLETETHIKRHDKFVRLFSDAKNYIMQLNEPSSPLCRFDLHTHLHNISKKILDLSLCIDEVEQCKLKAFNRVCKSIPPSEKGKESAKDCVIFEETLMLGEVLRTKGFIKKIVFASSNTKEYCEAKNVKPQIKTDLDTHSIEIVFSLNHGLSIVR